MGYETERYGEMNGTRHDCAPHELQRGEYGKYEDHGWYCRPPGSDLIGNISAHQITEHEDGTVSVSPSILINSKQLGSWHGYLERGVWREC